MLNSPIFSAKHSISVYFRLRFYQMRSIRLFLHKSYDTAQLLRNFSPLNMETVHTNTVSATNRIHNYSEEAIASNQYLIERSRKQCLWGLPFDQVPFNLYIPPIHYFTTIALTTRTSSRGRSLESVSTD